jgi:hypothetical protein
MSLTPLEVLFYFYLIEQIPLHCSSPGLHNSSSLPSAAWTAKFLASFIHAPFSAAVLS